MRRHLRVLLGLFAVSLGVPSAEAQTIGPFSRQTQPYCINLSTISGSWSDADGSTGTLAYGRSAAAATRPEPAAASSMTVAQFSPTVYAGPGSAATVSRSDHGHDSRYCTRTQSDATVELTGFSGSATTHDITAPVTVRRVTVTAPGAGTLVATGVASIIDGTATEYSCSVGTSGGYELDLAQFVHLATPVGNITPVRHLPVSAGAYAVTLFCDTTYSMFNMLAVGAIAATTWRAEQVVQAAQG